jgi:hypothetical protein
VSHLVVLVSQSLYLLACGVGGVSHEGLYLLDDVALLLQILALLVTCTSIGGVASLEELVAGVEEVVPELVADLLGHHADGFPFLLQAYYISPLPLSCAFTRHRSARYIRRTGVPNASLH